jgi:hypothetical protein
MGVFIFNKSVPANTLAAVPVVVGPVTVDGKYIRRVQVIFDGGVVAMSVGIRIIEDSQIFPAKGSDAQWFRGPGGVQMVTETNIVLTEEPYNLTVQFYNTDGSTARLAEVRIVVDNLSLWSLLNELKGILGRLLKLFTPPIAKPAEELVQ